MIIRPLILMFGSWYVSTSSGDYVTSSVPFIIGLTLLFHDCGDKK